VSALGTDPYIEYRSRLETRQTEFRRLTGQHIHIGNLRLLVALVFAVMAWGCLARSVFSPWWLLVPVFLFVVLAVRHELVIRGRTRAYRAAAFYERGIARLEDRWAGTGEAGERFRDSSHPAAADLDLFGKGGLFELLSTARTRMGEETLARWLLSSAPLEITRERQSATADLQRRLDLREDLAVLGADVGTGVHPEALVEWAEEAPVLVSRRARITAAALSALAVLSAVAWLWLELRALLLVVLAVEAGFAYWLRARVRRVVGSVELAAHDLGLLSGVLARLESEQFQSPRLVHLRAAFANGGLPPSRQIAKLNRLVDLLDSRDNLFMRLLGPPLLFTTQLAFAVEAWRQSSGRQVVRWLQAVGEMEALSAVAGYAYEHPLDPFPELSDEGALFDAEALGHPLLPASRCVRNNVRLEGELRVLIISGSNMSGKSTLLRTVGINAVLAMAGAPVRARRLRLSPLVVGASIRITDSLQGGTSRFYAEITRLRKLVDLTRGPFPLLFLLDELLHGTNSHDRRIGAEGIVRGLVERGAIGLVTTHDLVLAHIADELGPHGINVHFQDHLENGKISFDYRLRPGIVQKSNALELMRSIGLEV
jgi:hypothetical protein